MIKKQKQSHISINTNVRLHMQEVYKKNQNMFSYLLELLFDISLLWLHFIVLPPSDQNTQLMQV